MSSVQVGWFVIVLCTSLHEGVAECFCNEIVSSPTGPLLVLMLLSDALSTVSTSAIDASSSSGCVPRLFQSLESKFQFYIIQFSIDDGEECFFYINGFIGLRAHQLCELEMLIRSTLVSCWK